LVRVNKAFGTHRHTRGLYSPYTDCYSFRHEPTEAARRSAVVRPWSRKATGRLAITL